MPRGVMAPRGMFLVVASSTLCTMPISDHDEAVVLAIDPGFRVGYAYLNNHGRCLERGIESVDETAARLGRCNVPVAVGDGTERHQVLRAADACGVKVTVIGEAGTTLEGRELWRLEQGSSGFRRWLPKGLRLPPGPIDDYAAWAIGLRYLGITSGELSVGQV